MPEAISVTMGVCLGYAALAAYARSGSAVSAEAAAARQSAIAIVEAAERSQALFGEKAAAISGMRALANECVEPGWDGNTAAGMDARAVATAEDFIRALPQDVPLPEFAPEPDGSISLDWVQSRHRRITVSIGAGNRLAYAWLDGADRGHGVACFDGQVVPGRVLQVIQSITNHASAFLGVV